MHNDKDEVLIEKAVKATIPILYDEGLFVTNENAGEVLKDYLLIEVKERRRPDLDPLVVQSPP